MIDITKSEMLNGNITTLEVASLDDTNSEYMTDSQIDVINFDRVKDAYMKIYNDDNSFTMHSVDAILKANDRILLIEFKNGKMNKNQKYEVRWKLTDSILIFSDLTSSLIENIRADCDFILVYNIDKNPHSGDNSSEAKNAIFQGIRDLARNRYHRFGIAKYENIYFNKVFAYSQNEFEEFLSTSKIG